MSYLYHDDDDVIYAVYQKSRQINLKFGFLFMSSGRYSFMDKIVNNKKESYVYLININCVIIDLNCVYQSNLRESWWLIQNKGDYETVNKNTEVNNAISNPD